MRAVFGVASLLVVLVILGLLARTQLKAVSQAPVSVDAAASVPAPAGNLGEQSQQVQDKVRNDVSKALEQGAARREDADK